jgi:hypothetical protein
VAPLTATGRTSGRHPAQNESPQLEFASRVIGKDVTNRQREDLGQVSDLLVDLSAPERVFAIVSTGRFLRKHETYAMPLRALSPSTRGKKLVVDADRASFSRARLFRPDAANGESATGAATIFRYDERNPLNTSTTTSR